MRRKIKNCANLVYIVFKDAGSVINSIQGGITKNKKIEKNLRRKEYGNFGFL